MLIAVLCPSIGRIRINTRRGIASQLSTSQTSSRRHELPDGCTRQSTVPLADHIKDVQLDEAELEHEAESSLGRTSKSRPQNLSGKDSHPDMMSLVT